MGGLAARSEAERKAKLRTRGVSVLDKASHVPDKYILLNTIIALVWFCLELSSVTVSECFPTSRVGALRVHEVSVELP